MTTNSGDPDFVAPDPALVLLSVLAPADAERALAALRGAGCLRENLCDWPATDPGTLIQQEIRVTQWLPPADRMEAMGSQGRYGLAVTDGIQIDTLLGVLAIASEDVLAQRRRLLDEQ